MNMLLPNRTPPRKLPFIATKDGLEPLTRRTRYVSGTAIHIRVAAIVDGGPVMSLEIGGPIPHMSTTPPIARYARPTRRVAAVVVPPAETASVVTFGP